MQVNYQKDINHNYMTIQAEKEIDMDSYPIRMLLGNEIASLLPCRIQAVDGGRVFCYEIGSREDMDAILYVIHCGCGILATIHGDSIDDIRTRPILRKLVEEKVFERYVVLGRSEGLGTIESIFFKHAHAAALCTEM